MKHVIRLGWLLKDAAVGWSQHRAQRLGASLAFYATLALAAAVATFVLISAGGLVRATDSGLACPDWPGCFAFNDWMVELWFDNLVITPL